MLVYNLHYYNIQEEITMELIKVQGVYRETIGEDTTTYGREFDESKFGGNRSEK